MKAVTETSLEIVERSGSNLAFALAVLPPEKRDDMRVFYAFCRVADDIADDPGFSIDERRSALQHWRELIRGEGDLIRPGVEKEFVELVERKQLNASELEAIVDGVEMDLTPLRFQTADDLKRYCYHVASAVGLVSIELFGYTETATRDYAEQLGYALQWTNIMRDVGEDAEEGRVFLPLDDLEKFGLSESDLLSGNPDSEKFRALMEYQSQVAQAYYANAMRTLVQEDRGSMRSAELMRRIYSGILAKMERDGYRVFDKRYRLSKPRMIAEFLRAKLIG